jgi:predicted AAA+ superfamily ATPase
MERKVDKSLIEWKLSSNRKPLLLQGARQVGKTFSLENFGKKEFNRYFLFDFMENPTLNKIFVNFMSGTKVKVKLFFIFYNFNRDCNRS